MKRLAIALVFVLGFNARAALLYWDGSDSTADADGGSGIWNTSTLNWDNAATGGSAAAWVASSDAFFGGAAGVVTLGEAITAGTVSFNVPGYEIATAGFDMTLNLLAGTGSFTKSGAGTLTISGEGSSYSGKILVSGGMLKAGAYREMLGTDTAVDKLTVASGATFDVAGFWDINVGLTLAGAGTIGQGAYINSGADTGSGHVQMPNIALAADATIGGSGNFYMVAGGHNPNTLTLNGHTLTKVGLNTFCMVNTTVSAGSIHVVEGGFGVTVRSSNASAAAFTLDNTAGVSLVLDNQWLSVGSLTGGGNTGGNVLLGSGALTVGALNTSTLYAGTISGSGEFVKSGSGTLTLTGASNHTGATRVWGGRLNLAGSLTSPIIVGGGKLIGTGSTTKLLTLDGGGITLPGGATTQSLTVNGVTFNQPTRVTFETPPVSGTTYDILTYGSGTVSNLFNLAVQYRGSVSNDIANQKLVFTTSADGFATRTWNTTTGTWDLGATANWLEGDHLFYSDDHVIFGDIVSNSVVTLSTALYPNSITVNNATNQYAFQGGSIAGSTGLIKSGAGTLLISNENSYAGSTIVSNGTLKIGNKYALGEQATGQPVTKVVVTPGGTVDFNGVFDAIYGYTIAGSGVGSAGALVNNSITIDNGKAQSTNIRLASNAAIGGTGNWAILTRSYNPTRLDLAGHTLTKTGTNTIYLCNSTISTGTIQIASGTLSQTGPGIADATQTTFVLSDTPNAKLALNGINLIVGALAGGGDNGARVALDGASLTVGSLNTSNSFSGMLSGAGTLIKTGTNVWVLSGKNIGFTGSVIVNGGILKLGCEGGAGVNGYAALGPTYYGLSKVTVAVGATLDLAGFGNTSYGFTLAGNGTTGQGALVNTGAATSFDHIQTPFIALSDDAMIGGSGNFSMIGPGYSENALTLNGHTLTKAGANTFYLINTTVGTGSVHIAEGVLSLFAKASNASAAAFTLADKPSVALVLNNQGFSVGSLAGGGGAGGSVSLGSATLTIAGSNTVVTTYAGQISGTGALIKSGEGTQTLSGANNYTGSTTISGGTLLVNGSHTGGSGYFVTSGATLGGTGIVTLASNTVEVQADATLAPGAAANAGGTLLLSGLTMAPTAKLAIDNPGDKVVVAGNLVLDNTLVTIANTNLFSTVAGFGYPILTCNGIVTGKFEPHIDDTRWIVKKAGPTFYLRYNYPGSLLLIR